VCIWQSSCWYTALMSLGMTLIRANTLAFGFIGEDGPHRIIKICFGNMNLVFGNEVTLLGFWEYMFRILFRVQGYGSMKNVFLGSLLCLACLRIVLNNDLEEISYNYFLFNMFSLFIAWKMSRTTAVLRQNVSSHNVYVT
jgi:hypothetical protein